MNLNAIKYTTIIFIFTFINSVNAQITRPVTKTGEIPNKVTIKLPQDSMIIDTLSPQLYIDSSGVGDVDPNELRGIFLVHVLGGNNTAWVRVSDALPNAYNNSHGFEARNCIVAMPDYSDNGTAIGLLQAADVLAEHGSDNIDDVSVNWQAQYSSVGYKPKNNILIAHSQGGAVLRALMHKNFFLSPEPDSVRFYGGVVTVSSPLQGAMILNNRQMILDWAEDGCDKLTSGISSDVNLLVGGIIDKFRGTLCTNITNTIMPNILFKDYYDAITSDYLVGAPLINDMNQYANNTNINSEYISMTKVAFSGWEPQQNLFWRTAQWLITSPNDEANWEANDDTEFLKNTVEPFRNNYADKVVYYQNKINALKNKKWLFMGPGLIYYYWRLNKHIDGKNSWQDGLEWIDNVDNSWKTIIGAYEFVPQKDTFWTCLCHHDFNNPLNNLTFDNPNSCGDCFAAGPNYFYSVNRIYKESDGVVLQESSKNLPGANHPPVEIDGINIPGEEPTGSSHMQIRNDEGLNKGLTKLFDGNIINWFEVKPK